MENNLINYSKNTKQQQKQKPTLHKKTISHKSMTGSWRRHNLSIDIRQCENLECKNENEIYNEIREFNMLKELMYVSTEFNNKLAKSSNFEMSNFRKFQSQSFNNKKFLNKNTLSTVNYSPRNRQVLITDDDDYLEDRSLCCNGKSDNFKDITCSIF